MPLWNSDLCKTAHPEFKPGGRFKKTSISGKIYSTSKCIHVTLIKKPKEVGPIKKKWWPLDAKAVSNLIIVLLGILFYVLLTNFSDVRSRIGIFFDVISPFVAGFFVAYLLNSPVKFFEGKVYRKLRWRKGLAITTVYIIALAVVAVLINMILPQVVGSITELINNLRGYIDNLNALVDQLVTRFHLEGESIDALMVSYEDLMNRAASIVANAIPQILDFGYAVGSGVVTALTAFIASIYMLFGKKTLVSQIKSALYAYFASDKVDNFLHYCGRANGIFVGFINGKLIDSAIIGVLCFILCTILRIPYSLLISVIVGVTNVIPFFGPFIGAIPSAMILLIVDPWAALRFVIMVILLQQFDGNILGPKILGDSTGISAIWVLVSIVVGGGLFGFVGMLLGVPTFAVIYMLMSEHIAARLKKKQIDGQGKPLPQSDESVDTQRETNEE